MSFDASVLGSDWTTGQPYPPLREGICEKFPLGIQVYTNRDKREAMLKVIMPENKPGERVRFAGSFTPDKLRDMAKVLNQAARVLERRAATT
jgi:hypothetical protein